MRRIFSLVISLLAVVFIVMGVRWLIAPEGIAPEFGLILGDGLGLARRSATCRAISCFWASQYYWVSSRDIVPGFMQRHSPVANSRGAHYCLADSRRSTREPDSL